MKIVRFGGMPCVCAEKHKSKHDWSAWVTSRWGGTVYDKRSCYRCSCHSETREHVHTREKRNGPCLTCGDGR